VKTLNIVWQRLVKDGQTCGRCGATHEAILGALARLEAALAPLGIRPVLETRLLDEPTFRDDPSASNRIWIAGKPLEAWLGAQVGNSPCCTICGDLPCRTLEVAGSSFDAIPEHLIVQAGLIAAAGAIEPSQTEGVSSACCSNAGAVACNTRCD
jgi:hypothetical protein